MQFLTTKRKLIYGYFSIRISQRIDANRAKPSSRNGSASSFKEGHGYTDHRDNGVTTVLAVSHKW
jgi:hypothetical protein